MGDSRRKPKNSKQSKTQYLDYGGRDGQIRGGVSDEFTVWNMVWGLGLRVRALREEEECMEEDCIQGSLKTEQLHDVYIYTTQVHTQIYTYIIHMI